MSSGGEKDNVVRITTPDTAPTGNGGNGGSEIRERLVRLEERVNHLASKEDVQKIKVWILAGIIGAVPVLTAMVLLVVKFLVN